MDLLAITNNGSALAVAIAGAIFTAAAVIMFVVRVVSGKLSLVATAGAILSVVVAVVCFAMLPGIINASKKSGIQIAPSGGGYNLISAPTANNQPNRNIPDNLRLEAA